MVACSSAQPTPIGEADLNGMLSKGAQVEFMAGGVPGTMVFFGDKTVSREMNHSGQIDDGTWRVADGKLCITWKSPAAPEACYAQVKAGDQYQALNADGSVAMSYTVK